MGDDSVSGGKGSDVAAGGKGNDSVHGNTGDDVVLYERAHPDDPVDREAPALDTLVPVESNRPYDIKDVITAVVIGGTSVLGGRGSVLGTLLGAILVQTVTSGVTQLGWPSQLSDLFVGLAIILAVGTDIIRERSRRKKPLAPPPSPPRRRQRRWATSGGTGDG